MTLIVGRIERDAVLLVADSRLTNDLDQRRGYLAGGLKLLNVHPRLSVGFSGPAEDAVQVIRELDVGALAEFEVGEIETKLLDAHRVTDVDFLIASIEPGPNMRRIAEGRVTRGDSAWIGSHRGFEEFQKHLHKPRPNDEPSTADATPDLQSRMVYAMKAVIDDPAVPEVDGFAIRVAKHADTAHFEYLSEAAWYTGNVEFVIPAGRLTPIPMGGTPEGAFRYSFEPPTAPGVAALGVYIQPGNLGLLFHPLRSLYVLPFPNASQGAFESAVFTRYGISLRRFAHLDPI